MVTYYKDDDIGIIEFDDTDSKVNLLSHNNLNSLSHIIADIEKENSSVKALFFISRKEDIFIAGADIKELVEISSKEDALEFCKRGQAIFNRIEDLNVVTYSVVNGACIGGGLELALSCDYILAVNKKKVRFGLPEVKLGITPGFGGTHRLARKIGDKKAGELIHTGRLINLKEAKELNLIDGIIQESERFFYQKLLESYNSKKKSLCSLWLRKSLDKSERQKLSEKILQEPVKNSLSSFLLISKYKNYEWVEDEKCGEGFIKRCAVVGAGTMGRDIAYLVSSEQSIPVNITDVNRAAIKNASLHIKNIYKDAVERGIFCSREAGLKFKSISFGKDRLNDADIVVESITEDNSIKKSFFGEIEQESSKNSIIASNTSCYSIEGLSKSLRYTERFIGIHFFNPAYKMKLVEVVPTKFTSKKVLGTVISFLKSLRRIPIVVKDGPGFLVNRMLLPYLNEAVSMLDRGYPAVDIEHAMLEFGMPMGPLQLIEEIGVDVAYKASKILEQSLGSRVEAPETFREILGRAEHRSKSSRQSLNHIARQLLQPMRREAMLCLEEGVVDNREKVDIALLLGIGFPSSKRIWK